MIEFTMVWLFQIHTYTVNHHKLLKQHYFNSAEGLNFVTKLR